MYTNTNTILFCYYAHTTLQYYSIKNIYQYLVQYRYITTLTQRKVIIRRAGSLVPAGYWYGTTPQTQERLGEEMIAGGR